MLYLIFSLILFQYAHCVVEDLFGFDVDELFRSRIGPVYEVRRTAHTVPAYNNFTTTPLPRVTPYTNYDYQNDSREPLLKKQIDLECILKDEVSGTPKFDVDEIEILSRNFDKVLEDDKKKTDMPSRREMYDENMDDKHMIQRSKFMCLLIMEQFVYQTRYTMPYAQKMRREYIPRVRYKIGYAFSLMNIIKRKQYILYSVMNRNRGIFDNYFEFLKILQKILRLDLELKDLILFIKRLEQQRIDEFAEKRTKVNKQLDDNLKAEGYGN